MNKLYDGMLPADPKPGKLGYYPVSGKQEWEVLPDLYKVMEWSPIKDPHNNGQLRAVKSVEFDVLHMEPYGIHAKVSVHPQDVQKILFCNFKDTDCHLYTVSGIELEGGTRLSAKWYQDSMTGAFAIMANHQYVGMQGGFGGYIPEHIQKLETGEFRYDWKVGEGKTAHYTFSNPFKAEEDRKESPLLTFIEEEVPFRFKEVLDLDASDDVINSIIVDLQNDTDVLFNYDRIDNFILEKYAEYTQAPVWITVYKDALGIEDNHDNLTEISVPIDWLIDQIKTDDFSPEEWLNEYTADDTVHIAANALADGVILGYSDKEIAAILNERAVIRDFLGKVACEAKIQDNVLYLDGIKVFFGKDGGMFCKLSNESDYRPVRMQIQDITEGDAFFVGNSGRISTASDSAHQNFDEHDEPWIVYGNDGEVFFEEDIGTNFGSKVTELLRSLSSQQQTKIPLDSMIRDAAQKIPTQNNDTRNKSIKPSL